MAPSLADSGKPTHFLKDIETKGPRGQWAAQLLDIHVMTGAVVSLPVAGHLPYSNWPFNL